MPTRPRASSRSSSRSSSTTSPACAACGPTSSGWAAASARADRGRRRSRPTGAWPATASPPCAGAWIRSAPPARTYLLTDTVGFIRKLPHQLVDAFGATLEETRRADVILHVVDASATDEEIEAMMGAVDGVLDEIGAGDRPRVLVLNKIDLLGG